MIKENKPTFETVEITELYYVKKDTARLAGITVGFEFWQTQHLRRSRQRKGSPGRLSSDLGSPS